MKRILVTILVKIYLSSSIPEKREISAFRQVKASFSSSKNTSFRNEFNLCQSTIMKPVSGRERESKSDSLFFLFCCVILLIGFVLAEVCG